MRLQAQALLDLYDAEIQRLIESLSQSTRRVGVSSELLASIAADAERVGANAAQSVREFPFEPYRQKLALMRAKLALGRERMERDRTAGEWQRAPSRSAAPGHAPAAAEIVRDIDVLHASLVAHGGHRLAESDVADFGWRVRTFGRHFAALDVRQHARVHEAAVADLLVRRHQVNGYESMREDEKRDVLGRLLSPPPSRGRVRERGAADALAPDTIEALSLFTTMRDIQHELGREACPTYIVSAADDVSDLLEVLFLAREAGVEVPTELELRIVPLFESIDTLRRSPVIVHDLLSKAGYRGVLSGLATCRRSWSATRTATRTAATSRRAGSCIERSESSRRSARGSGSS